MTNPDSEHRYVVNELSITAQWKFIQGSFLAKHAVLAEEAADRQDTLLTKTCNAFEDITVHSFQQLQAANSKRISSFALLTKTGLTEHNIS